MNCFEVADNDLDIILIKFTDYYLKELTYYGSSKTDQMMMLITMGEELGIIEKNIIDNYYNYYVGTIINDITDPNIYYVRKILFTFTNMIIKMIVLFVSNETNTEEYHYKSRYLIGCVENYVNKIIEPIENKSEHIIGSNKIFKFNYPLMYIKNYIETNKTLFTSRDKFEKLKKIVVLFEKN